MAFWCFQPEGKNEWTRTRQNERKTNEAAGVSNLKKKKVWRNRINSRPITAGVQVGRRGDNKGRKEHGCGSKKGGSGGQHQVGILSCIRTGHMSWCEGHWKLHLVSCKGLTGQWGVWGKNPAPYRKRGSSEPKGQRTIPTAAAVNTDHWFYGEFSHKY